MSYEFCQKFAMLTRLSGFLIYLLIINFIATEGQIHEHKKMKSHMEAKIVGGTPVTMEKFPSMVQLYNQGNMCAGNILNSWTVLTAAHCFDYNTDTSDIVVQVGSRYVYDLSAKAYGVISIAVHDKYNETRNFACDIALVFLETYLSFTKEVKKGVLVADESWMTKNEKNFTVTGWGYTKYENGEISKDGLRMTFLKFIPIDECGRMHHLTFTKDMFCLYGEGTRDTCKGDSGGGVLWHEMIVGLTSHGDGCAKKHKPSVYSNVFYFRSWINKQINIFYANYCKNETEIDIYNI